MITRVLLCLGANLGDPLSAFREAVADLGETVEATSEVYTTPPWGDPDQPPYLNAVVLASGDRTPGEWLEAAQAIEIAAGRVRDPERRYGPRVLDIDIIAAWDAAGEPILSDDEWLTLPHPRAHLRAFVLVPWSSIQPDAVLPGHGRISDLLTGPLAADAREVNPTGHTLR